MNFTIAKDSPCLPNLWRLQLSISFGIPLAIFVVGLIIKQIKLVLKKYKVNISSDSFYTTLCNNHYLIYVQMVAVRTLGGKNKFGIFFSTMRAITIISSGSIFIYVTYREGLHVGSVDSYLPIYFCIPWRSDSLLIIDFLLQLVFLVHFMLFVLSTEDLLQSLLCLDALVNYLTITPQFLMVILGYHNYGLRFFNFVRLNSAIDILLQFNIIRKPRKILFLKLILSFLSIWLTGAGIFQLLDALNDNFNPIIPSKQITYFESMYFLLITMSTVGYGDFSPNTVPSKLFIIIFVIFAIGLFASFIPQLMTMVSIGNRYSISYSRRHGQRHILVCGNINYHSVDYFLKDFYHKERTKSNNDIQIVFLSEELPDMLLETMLSRKWTKIKYLRGKVSNAVDLKRAKIRYADCVVILSDTSSRNPDITDWSNVLQVIAIKQEEPHVQIIVQIIEYKNKQLLKCIPEWNSERDINPDKVVCMKELQMGLLGQSALVPGFSTIFTNCLTFVHSRHNHLRKKCFHYNSWKSEYLYGASNTLLNVSFSKGFDGISFPEAVRICYVELSVILLAVAMRPSPGKPMCVKINPSQNFIISPSNMTALVLSPSSRAARKLEIYCPSCHHVSSKVTIPFSFTVSTRPKSIQCTCHLTSQIGKMDKSESSNPFARKQSEIPKFTKQLSYEDMDLNDDEVDDMMFNMRHQKMSSTASIPDMAPAFANYDDTDSNDIQFDETNLFHWNKEKNFEDMILNQPQALAMNFSNHIVIFLLSHDSSKSVDFSPFILPLRSSTINREQLQDIVIIGNVNILREDWLTLKNLSHIYLINGSPISDTLLHIINLKECYSCVILSLSDNISHSTCCHQLQADNLTSADISQIDREAILCTLNIKKHLSYNHTVRERRNNFIITQLIYESNSNYIYPQRDSDGLRLGYITGAIFNASKLNILMSTNYFSPTSLLFLETLLAGNSISMVENIFSRGLGLIPRIEKSNDAKATLNDSDDGERYNQCRISLLDIQSLTLRFKEKPVVFRDLFLGLLKHNSIICIGLYRQIPIMKPHRFVYTFPSSNTVLKDSDMVYFLQSFQGHNNFNMSV